MSLLFISFDDVDIPLVVMILRSFKLGADHVKTFGDDDDCTRFTNTIPFSLRLI